MTLVNEAMQKLEDNWIELGDESSIPVNANSIVSFRRLKLDAETLYEKVSNLGVTLNATVDIEEISPFLARVAVVLLNFESFTDGRPFSQARLLRDRYRYAGHIRATGEVLADQVSFMRRCGFDQFVLSDDYEFEGIKIAIKGLSHAYQKELNF